MLLLNCINFRQKNRFSAEVHRRELIAAMMLPWSVLEGSFSVAPHQQAQSCCRLQHITQIAWIKGPGGIDKKASLTVVHGLDSIVHHVLAGDERPGQPPSDVVIIIDEKPHSVFRREGNDLHYTYRLPLADALCGPTMRIPTLDGRQLDVVMEGVAHPNAVKVVRGEGMPISKAPGTKGDLRIHFDIVFPKSLSPQQKAAIRANLPAR